MMIRSNAISREFCRFLLALLLVTGGVPDLAAQDVSVRDHHVVTLRQETQVLWRDVATVRDVVRQGWSPATIAAAPAGWVLAQVIPRRDDEWTDATEPDLTVPHRDVMNVAGNLQIAHRFAGDAALFGTLPVAWAVAMNAESNDPRAHLVFGERQGGGLICARIVDPATGVRVEEVILLPEPWSSAELIAAVGVVAARDGRAWGADLAPVELLTVIRERNPWLSIAALHAALGRSDLAMDGLLAALVPQREESAATDRASSVRQAVLLGMIVAHDLTATQRAAVVAHLGRLIGQVRSAADLRGLLLVAWALSDLGRGPDGRKDVLDTIVELAGMLRFRQQDPFADDVGLALLRRLAPVRPSLPARPRQAASPDPLRAEVERDLAVLQSLVAWPLPSAEAVTLVVDIVPDPQRGGTLRERCYRHDPDGAIVPLGLRGVDVVVGRVTLRAQVSGPPISEQEWTESWNEPRTEGANQPSSAVAALVRGGSALVEFSAAQQGSARYPSVLLIPDGWIAGAGAAYQTIAAHPAWFQPATAPAHRADLATTMAGANDLLALRAGLLLIDHQAWEDDFADVHVLPRQGLLQAMILLRMVTQAQPHKLAALDARVRAFIGGTRDPAALYGIALVAHALQHGLVASAPMPAPGTARVAADAWWVELLRKRFLPTASDARERQLAQLASGL